MRAPRRRARGERGLFTLVEILIASIVLAMSAVTTAYWVETVGNLSSDADEQSIGNGLVQVIAGLMADKALREPGSDGSSFGPEPNELTVTAFDDVDDFHGLISSPPLDEHFEPQADLGQWTTQIWVTIVSPDTLAPASSSDLRMIHVQVTRRGRVVGDSWWLRARSPFE